jgi:hypothetical protein
VGYRACTSGYLVIACTSDKINELEVSDPPSIRTPPRNISWFSDSSNFSCESRTESMNEWRWMPAVLRSRTLARTSPYKAFISCSTSRARDFQFPSNRCGRRRSKANESTGGVAPTSSTSDHFSMMSYSRVIYSSCTVFVRIP